MTNDALTLNDNGCGETITAGRYYGFRDERNNYRVIASRGMSTGWKWHDEAGRPLSADALASLMSRVVNRRVVCG